MRRLFVRSFAIAFVAFALVFGFEFFVEWRRAGYPGWGDMSWAEAGNNEKLVDTLSPMARAYNNLLAMLIATIGLAIPLTANMHTPKLIEMFLRDRLNQTILIFGAFGAANVLFIDYIIGPGFAPVWAIRFAVLGVLFGWTILIPYFFYVVRFVDPSNILLRLKQRVLDTGPLALAGLERNGAFDVIDITREFLAQSDTNRAVLSAETLAVLLGMLTPTGFLSFTVSIREFPVYAVQAMVAAHAALRRAGITQPARHVVIYRSAFNVRLLLSPTPFEPATLDAIARFCDERSFDLVHLAGRDLAGVRVYNSLSLVSFIPTAGPAESDGDPLRQEAAAILAGLDSPFHS